MNKPEKFSKGIIISQLALATSLINAGVLTVEEVIDELDNFINIFTVEYSDDAIKEPIELIKSMILKSYEKPKLGTATFSWVADFAGEA
jgi:hypothetical protein